jgi:hypothetical protein
MSVSLIGIQGKGNLREIKLAVAYRALWYTVSITEDYQAY